MEEGPLCWSVRCVELVAESVESAAPLEEEGEEVEELLPMSAALKISLVSLLLLESMKSPQGTMSELKWATQSMLEPEPERERLLDRPGAYLTYRH